MASTMRENDYSNHQFWQRVQAAWHAKNSALHQLRGWKSWDIPVKDLLSLSVLVQASNTQQEFARILAAACFVQYHKGLSTPEWTKLSLGQVAHLAGDVKNGYGPQNPYITEKVERLVSADAWPEFSAALVDLVDSARYAPNWEHLLDAITLWCDPAQRSFSISQWITDFTTPYQKKEPA